MTLVIALSMAEESWASSAVVGAVVPAMVKARMLSEA